MTAQLSQFIGCDKPFDAAKVVLFGAPYDSTTSFRPGTRFGPAAMRSESFGIETYSMLQDRDIAEDAAVFDSGDLELPFGAPDRALDMIEERASEILDAGKTPFLLGGEHLVTLGAVRAVAKRRPGLVEQPQPPSTQVHLQRRLHQQILAQDQRRAQSLVAPQRSQVQYARA